MCRGEVGTWVSYLSRGGPSRWPPWPPGAAGFAPQGRGMRGCRAEASCLIWPSLTATLDLHLSFISIRLKRNSIHQSSICPRQPSVQCVPSFDRVQLVPVVSPLQLSYLPHPPYAQSSLPRLSQETPPTGQPISSINQSPPDALAAHPAVQHRRRPPTKLPISNIPRSTAKDGAQYRPHISQIVSTTGTQSGTFRVFWVKPFETSRRRSPAET